MDHLSAPSFHGSTSIQGEMDEEGASRENTDFESDEDILMLQPSTLTALTSFFDEQEAAREAMSSLAIQFRSSDDNLSEEREGLAMEHPQAVRPRNIGVDEFKGLFKENWQLSQFWYSQDTATRLAQAIKGACPTGARVAFVCCPTGYVAFKESASPARDVLLLEYDPRFAVVAGTDFVPYDLDEPVSFSRAEALSNSIDIVVVDPPFHSEVSQKNISLTVEMLLRPGGRIVLLTGVSLWPLIKTIYPSPPLPRLCRRDIIIEHDGVGRLETPYGCWIGGGTGSDDVSGFGGTLEDVPVIQHAERPSDPSLLVAWQ